MHGAVHEFGARMLVSSDHRTYNIPSRFDSQLEVCDDVILRTSSIALFEHQAGLVGTAAHPDEYACNVID